MVCKYPFDLKVISYVLGVPYDKFYKWFKHHLSDFKKPEIQEKLHQYDIKNTGKSGQETIFVPLVKPEHIGRQMAIDEKHIDGQFYTILTNGKTGKVAMMASTINGTEIGQCLNYFGDSLKQVTTITRDLSPTYEKVCTTHFPNATQVADKYHIVQMAIESLQELRIRYKQEALTTQRKEEKEHRQSYHAYMKTKEQGVIIEKVGKKYIPKRLENSETKPEMLSRCNYLLYKKANQWTEKQRKRAKLLFSHYPDIEKAYEYILEFRDWYDPMINKTNFMYKENQLWNWIYTVETCNIEELLNFRNSVENNADYILNYYQQYATNAIAESTNAKIQGYIRNNNGTRDIDFFHYRLGLIL
jgi:transposase